MHAAGVSSDLKLFTPAAKMIDDVRGRHSGGRGGGADERAGGERGRGGGSARRALRGAQSADCDGEPAHRLA